ncbi:shikimate kinase [Caloramator quimbayensis]|uniref:Shikimate kinase n=2 Tax=Caloramator quimbayensis TaxID=1147123 RepID=A0A1T4WYF0_9CLOT|nr:shikimate kinase [Caloramator quimbayensis]
MAHNMKVLNMNKNYQIALIGMPGSGKTTVGRRLSSILDVPFFDVDEFIRNKTKKTIDELFLKGEEYFRDIETDALREISKISPCVISTGGGAVTRYENMELLSKAIIIYLYRPLQNIIKDIDCSLRPLLKNNPDRVFELYNERKNLYEKYCNFKVINDKTIDNAVENIIEKVLKIL